MATTKLLFLSVLCILLVLSVYFQTCKIYFISIEHICPVITVFEYVLCFFVLLLYVPVNSYGHGGPASSPKHTFFLDKLEQAVN